MRELGALVGRSAYAEAAEVEQTIVNVRKDVAGLIGTDDPRRIVFTLNGTDSLNTAIHGVLRPGDHVVTTVAEHNSVLRPLRALEDAKQIGVTRLRCGAEGIVDPADLRTALRPKTRLIAMTHASNVTGALQPAADVGAIARERGCAVPAGRGPDAGRFADRRQSAQRRSAGSAGTQGIARTAGHRRAVRAPGVEGQMQSLRQGGTGSRSEEDRQPEFLPDKHESGNLNVPGILGLGAGVAYLRQRGLAAIHEQIAVLTAQLIDGLSAIAGVTVYGPRSPKCRVGIVSMNIRGFDPQEVAASLDAARRVQVRSGIHCAPRMHEALGTLETGGTVRMSIGPFNTAEDIEAAVEAVAALAAASG